MIFEDNVMVSNVLIGIMMTRNLLNWILGEKTLKNYHKLVGYNLYTLLGMKNTIIKASVDQCL